MKTLKKRIRTALLIASPIFLLEPRGFTTHTITIAGSETVRPVVEEAVKVYGSRAGASKFVVGGGGSSHGIEAVFKGQVDIGMASRDLKPGEREKFPGLETIPIGMDGVAIVVNSRNQLKSITKQQVHDLYTGRNTNWRELGGPDAAVQLISLDEGHGTLEVFKEYFELSSRVSGEGPNKVVLYASHIQPGAEVKAVVSDSHRETLAAISTKPAAIGFVSVGLGTVVAARSPRLKLLTLDGVEPTVANVASRTYPLCRPLLLLVKVQPSTAVKQFIDFLTGKQGRSVVSSQNLIPLP
jgi:phosphate transport system substrate-binding protein